MAKDAYGNPVTPITATDVDTDYGTAVVDRIVGIYPTASTRDAALTSPDEGQMVYLTGVDEFQIYTGSAWSTVAYPGSSTPTIDYDTSNVGYSDDTAAFYSLATMLNSPFPAEVEVTLTTRSRVLVTIAATLSNSNAGSIVWLGMAISGATTIAASSARCMQCESSSANDTLRASYTRLYAVTPGSNTFTLAARVSGGLGKIQYPEINVVPL